MKKLIVSSVFWGAVWGLTVVLTIALVGEIDSLAWQSALYGVYIATTVQLIGLSSKRHGYKTLTSLGYWVGLASTAAAGMALVLGASAVIPAGLPDFPETISFFWAMVGGLAATFAFILMVWAFVTHPESGKKASV